MAMRYLKESIEELCFKTGKMVFLSGPRQAGKTTFAKLILKTFSHGSYYNWDDLNFRKNWAKNPSHILLPEITKSVPLIVLDEIHKMKLWKRNLKGVYDTMTTPHQFIVTGSARLTIYKKGSDSMVGRYFNFRLHPFSLAELLKNKATLIDETLIEALFSDDPPKVPKKSESYLDDLYEYGPFPDPLFTKSKRFLNAWQLNRIERLVREDLRDLSRLPELSQIEMLTALLPEKCSNPLSIQSLSEDLEAAYSTVKRWLTYLKELYFHIELKPYSKTIRRSLKKEGKLYLWDWSVIENQGAKFENLIAMHLLKYCHFMTDCGYAKYELFYLKNKEGSEIDFLIVRNNIPFLPVEVKLTDSTPSQNWPTFFKDLPCKQGIQVVKTPDIRRRYAVKNGEVMVMSADQFLAVLVSIDSTICDKILAV